MRALTLAFAFTLSTATAAVADDLPNPQLTPGDADPSISVSDLCPTANPSLRRNVSAAEKAQVFEEYGLAGNHTGYCENDDPHGCEVDHLISLELGGSNDIKNLWPQPYAGTIWNAHVKDKLENRLHAMVCSGEISLKDAQHEIATDWVAAYRKYLGSPDH
jgi:hypothetical protein